MTNKEKKELKEGEEGSEEKNLEKSIKEQKEVLQALQRDVNTIRGSLQEIRDDFAGLKDLSDLDHQKITRIKSILEKSKIDAELEEALNNGIITEELKTTFESKGLSLSENIHITKEKDNKWVITDGKNYYIIRKEMGELNIYHDKFEMRRVNFVNFWYTLGGSFTTVGFALIGIGFSLWNIYPSAAKLAVIYGFILSVGVGMLMIFGAYHAGINLKKYPDELGIKEVFGTKLLNMNRYLFIAFLGFIVCCVIALIVFLFFHP
ncbi:MAG: hypothetical protein U9O85_01770 [Euryarchaeota archaeon]|nr:hypothetical protein [Euryarchaeota archaeon]